MWLNHLIRENWLSFKNKNAILYTMVVRMRHTRGHTRNRRAHHALKSAHLASCPKCKAPILQHRVCENCGYYKGKEVIDVLAKLTKKERKKKKKELENAESTKS